MCGDHGPEEHLESLPQNYREAYRRACQRMAGRDLRIDAETAGVTYVELEEGKGRFEIPLLNQTYEISWPNLEIREKESGTEPSLVVQILLLHYLLTSDGISLRGQWVSFRDLPDGRVYYPAFRAGSEERLRERFGHDIAALRLAAERLGGRPAAMADHAFVFQVLPRLPMALLLWEGDEEFPPEVHLLFDSTAANYLPTEDLAVIARYLCACLLRAAKSLPWPETGAPSVHSNLPVGRVASAKPPRRPPQQPRKQDRDWR